MADPATGGPKMPGGIKRLGDALWGAGEDDISHEECRSVLPQFVEAEVAGEDAAALYPRVQRHLDHCDECGEEYAMLVDLELAEEAGDLKVMRETAQPLFSYQQARTADVQTIVVNWTRALVAMLAPANVGDVDRAADSFFAALVPRRAMETRAEYGAAFGIGKGETNPAYATLAAGFATTQELVALVSRQQFDDWLALNTLGAELETRAQATARGIGLAETAAREFGRAFAQVVMQDPETMRNLLAS